MTMTPEVQTAIISIGAFLLSEIIGMSKLKSNSVFQLVVAIIRKVVGK